MREGIFFILEIGIDIRYRLVTSSHIVHDVVQRPPVAGFKCVVMQLRVLGFGKHIDLLHAFQFLPGAIPKLRGHQVGHIAAEAIDADLFNPETHFADHGITERVIFVIKLQHIRPVFIGWEKVAIGIGFIILRIGFCPIVIPAVWLATQSRMTYIPRSWASSTIR